MTLRVFTFTVECVLDEEEYEELVRILAPDPPMDMSATVYDVLSTGEMSSRIDMELHKMDIVERD